MEMELTRTMKRLPLLVNMKLLPEVVVGDNRQLRLQRPLGGKPSLRRKLAITNDLNEVLKLPLLLSLKTICDDGDDALLRRPQPQQPLEPESWTKILAEICAVVATLPFSPDGAI